MSAIIVKTAEEIALMRQSGKLLARVFDMLKGVVKPGVSTLEINDRVEDYIVNDLKSRPASKGQYGFQFALNTSVNEVVCHGIPSKDRLLKATDIINVDITLEKDGFITDSSTTFVLPAASRASQKLVKTTYRAMWAGIKEVRPGARLGDVGAAIQKLAETAGYSIVKEYCGHGIGRDMHEGPSVMHFGKRGTGTLLKEGMTFTIEPMVNAGTELTVTKEDGWTVETLDRKLSAQWEHTILVTKTGFEVLTLRDGEKIPG
ncbi:Methionine aminopeptidase [Pseudovibrio axinellae]|uniref:Methionine aminopeptidase n=1 Tax=Pseudovibrio axinellae TaxID=989403 RepID=A0A165VSU0_9HYPH|nr:type I methionyl aminopeptidase [Pseudovibrio axinellae]KZL15392.1 Methionine aminopeptidase [Pseudovibrio axinellae]SER54473.1 methionyl aminopeptidase [Pseudovibrio axinellae]